jgi:hypothetical protein
MSHNDPLLRHQAWMAGTRNAGLTDWNGHNFLHPKGQDPTCKGKGHHVGSHHLPHQAGKIEEPNQTRLVAGGDRVHYPFHTGTPTADLLTTKLLINSMISTPGARFFTMNIKNFYLCTPMTRYEYMRLKLSNMPDNIITHYHLNDIATPDGYIYCKIFQGM